MPTKTPTVKQMEATLTALGEWYRAGYAEPHDLVPRLFREASEAYRLRRINQIKRDGFVAFYASLASAQRRDVAERIHDHAYTQPECDPDLRSEKKVLDF
tara:strand:- start:3522 stop:3821 length:300 start_codon:yes stop_codon:yes gene_type:complete